MTDVEGVGPRVHGEDAVVVEHLRRHLTNVVAIYRFGSTVDRPRRDSDVDIAVLAERPLASDRRFDLQEQIASRIGRDVDLVDLQVASTVLAVQVVAAGRLLYESDASARGAFEDRALTMYARLNEERRGILERVTRERTVYGR